MTYPSELECYGMKGIMWWIHPLVLLFALMLGCVIGFLVTYYPVTLLDKEVNQTDKALKEICHLLERREGLPGERIKKADERDITLQKWSQSLGERWQLLNESMAQVHQQIDTTSKNITYLDSLQQECRDKTRQVDKELNDTKQIRESLNRRQRVLDEAAAAAEEMRRIARHRNAWTAPTHLR